MKIKQLVLITMLLGSFSIMNGQAYKSAIGAKAGNVLLGSFKTFLGEKLAFEGVSGFGLDIATDVYFGAYLQLHYPIGSVENLTWFAGLGPNAAIYNAGNDSVSIGIGGIGGADYRIGNTPLNVSVDVTTPIYFTGNNDFLGFVPFFSASARYIFGESSNSGR